MITENILAVIIITFKYFLNHLAIYLEICPTQETNRCLMVIFSFRSMNEKKNTE